MKSTILVAVVWLVTAALFSLGCVTPTYPSDDSDSYYRKQRAQQQLQHGAGGCAPNFGTGGCL